MDSLTLDIALQEENNKNLETVKKLNLWASDLSDVSLVKEMPNLEVLVLSANNITSLKDIQFCENLRELYLRNNKIESLNEIFYLKRLKNLKILWLDENPCSESENYRINVIKNLSSLEYLDNIEVITEDEIQQAIESGQNFDSPPDSIRYDELIAPLSSLNITDEENSVNYFKLTDETETNDLNSLNNLKNQENSIEENIEEVRLMAKQEKNEKSNVLSAILILLKNLDLNELNQVIHECEKLKNS